MKTLISNRQLSLVKARPNAIFTHNTTESNIHENLTFVDNDLFLVFQKCSIVVLPKPTPNDALNNEDIHPLGVMFDKSRKQWVIFNKDEAPMREGLSFNIIATNFDDLFIGVHQKF
jgi:hypothetical protein